MYARMFWQDQKVNPKRKEKGRVEVYNFGLHCSVSGIVHLHFMSYFFMFLNKFVIL